MGGDIWNNEFNMADSKASQSISVNCNMNTINTVDRIGQDGIGGNNQARPYQIVMMLMNRLWSGVEWRR